MLSPEPRIRLCLKDFPGLPGLCHLQPKEASLTRTLPPRKGMSRETDPTMQSWLSLEVRRPCNPPARDLSCIKLQACFLPEGWGVPGEKMQSAGHPCPLQSSTPTGGTSIIRLTSRRKRAAALFRDSLSECREELGTFSTPLEGGCFYSLHLTDEETVSDGCGHRSHGEPWQWQGLEGLTE